MDESDGVTKRQASKNRSDLIRDSRIAFPVTPRLIPISPNGFSHTHRMERFDKTRRHGTGQRWRRSEHAIGIR